MIEFSSDYHKQRAAAQLAARALGKVCWTLLHAKTAVGEYARFEAVLHDYSPERCDDPMTATVRLAQLWAEMTPSHAAGWDALHEEHGADALLACQIAAAVTLDCDCIGHMMEGVAEGIGARAFTLATMLQEPAQRMSGPFLAKALEVWSLIEMSAAREWSPA